MDTKFLKTFIAVADSGSMAAAARLLNITPAGVAQQIRSLERQIEAPLIRRSGRTVTVTEAGARILEQTRNVLKNVAELRTLAIDNTVGGELRLGACNTALTGILPDILSRVVKCFPQISVSIQPGLSIDLHRSVENGELDAAFVLQAPFTLYKTCCWQLLREEALILLAPQSMSECDPHELLRTHPFIRYDRNLWGGHLAEQYLNQVEILPNQRCELAALNAIAVMVDRGLGVSLVPDWAQPWPEGLQLARISLPIKFERRKIGVVWSRASTRSRLLEAFIQEVQASTPSLK